MGRLRISGGIGETGSSRNEKSHSVNLYRTMAKLTPFRRTAVSAKGALLANAQQTFKLPWAHAYCAGAILHSFRKGCFTGV